MDGESFKHQCGAGVDDRISKLPEKTIVLILSFLSVKEAAATSLLSHQWRNLWKQTPNLIFSPGILNLNNPTSTVQGEEESSWDVERCEYVELVNSVLHSHRPPSLKLFKISFYVNRSAQPQVEDWLDFLLSTRVESVDLDFRCWKEANNKVVLGEYLWKRQKRLSQCSDISLFKSLKKLSLKCFQLSGEDIKILLHNCPLLKMLIINAATLTSDVEICGANLVLKELEMYSCLGTRCIKVSAPKLGWIRVDNTSGKLLFENVPKLYSARFRIRNRDPFAQHFAPQVSCFISRLRFLTLSLYHPKDFLEGFPRLPNLRKLVIEDYGHYEHEGFLHLADLVWASPRLEEFYLKFLGEYKDSAPPNVEAKAIKNVKRIRHRNLKTFRFRGPCRGVSNRVVQLAARIAKKCCALEKVIIGRILMASSDIGAEVEARESIKRQLQPKLLPHIQLQISRPI